MKLQEFIKKHGNVNVSESELKELLGIRDEKYFIPAFKESYWHVRNDGISIASVYDGEDFDIIKDNEVFQTKEEAEEHARKQRFLLKMKRAFLDNTDEIDWRSTNQAKYNLFYNADCDDIYIEKWATYNHGGLHTTNKPWLAQYILEHEEEIKRYYFEIKEEIKND